MRIGSEIKFSFKNKQGVIQQTTLTLSNHMVEEDVMSDAAIIERMAPQLQRLPKSTLVQQGYVLAVRNLLKTYPDATQINLQEIRRTQQQSKDNGMAVLLLAVIAIIVAIICFPLLVMLGMHGKLFLKGFYEKCQSEEYKKFAKGYMFAGIGLYAVVAILIAVDYIFELFVLSGPAFGLLFAGGVAYFVISLIIVKKKFVSEGSKLNFIDTLKAGFKKGKKEKEE